MSDPQQFPAQPSGIPQPPIPQPPVSPGAPAPQSAPAYGTPAPQTPAAPSYAAQGYAGPGSATPPYGATGYGAPAQPSPAAPGATPGYGAAPAYGAAPVYAAPSAPVGNPLGRVAFLIAAITVGLSVLSTLIYPILFIAGAYDASSALSSIIAILVFLGGAAALVLGIIALRRPEPRLLAAIAVGLAGTVVLGRLFGWISSLMYSLF